MPQPTRPLRTRSTRILPTPLNRVLNAALIALTLAITSTGPAAHAAEPAALDSPVTKSYHIDAGPLGRALSSAAVNAGIALSFEPALTDGLTSPALSGNFSAREAFARLLAGSGLEIVGRSDGSYTLRKAHTRPSPTSAAPEATLPAVRVSAPKIPEGATGPAMGYVVTRSSTGTKTDTLVNEIAQSISVITADQIRDQAAKSIDEALLYTPGVMIQGNDNRTESFSIRGGSQGAYILLDGLRQPRSGYGVVRDLPYAYERIEVLRGPSSVIAGQNGPGGVLNLVSKRPQAEAAREVSVEIGSYAHRQIAADFTGPIKDDGSVLYRLVALGQQSDTQVQYEGKKSQYFAPSITFLPFSGTRLTAYAEYLHQKSGNTTGFLPIEGTLLPGPHGQIPVDRFVGEPDWDTFGGRRTRFGWELEQRLSSDWTLRHHFRHEDINGLYRTLLNRYWLSGAGYTYFDADGTPNNASGRYLSRRWDVSQDKGVVSNADVLFEGHLRTGSVKHTLLTGLDFVSQRVHQTEWGGDLYAADNLLDIYTPTYGSWTPPDLSTVTPVDAHTTTRQLGVLLQDQIKVDERWGVTLGVRHDAVRQRTSDQAQSDPIMYQHTDGAWSKNFGLVYLADGGWSPYASYSESFETQGMTSGGTFLKPKRGKQTEGGIKWLPADGRFSASAAVYRLQETNRLQEGDTPTTFVNMPPVTVRGLELEARANLQALSLIGAFTLQSGQEDESGLKIQGLPHQQLAVWANYDFSHLGARGLQAGIGVRHVGKTPDGSNLYEVPTYTLWDAMLAWDLGTWRWALNARNLTDKTYVSACSGFCAYGAKRQITASAIYRF